MYSPHEIEANREQLREAVLHARPFTPLYVKMKVFYGCNLKCEMCNHWRERREPPVPAVRLMEVQSVSWGKWEPGQSTSPAGSPCCGRNIPEFVELASSLGIKVTMTTNGTLVDKVKAKRLVEGGLRGVNLSIDSPNRKMHEKIRGVEGSFKATAKAVRLLQRYRHKGKLIIRINTVVSRTNYQTLESLPDLAHELGADGINLIPVDDHCGEPAQIEGT